ncbi:vesicular glutamate transporter 1-like [Babylonia areolata]|uniref:vesicular glutamate transporter 1-like n=1 Tax=Babylonia areolata TaxID=304850 RepID=UPI003FD18CD4
MFTSTHCDDLAMPASSTDDDMQTLQQAADIPDNDRGKTTCRRLSPMFQLAAMLSVGHFLMGSLRTSFALVMTHVTVVNQSTNADCPVSNTSYDAKIDMKVDVMLMSHTALFLGLGVSILPVGIITNIVSPARIAGFSCLTMSGISLLFPVTILHCGPLIFLLRGLEGVTDSFTQSAAFALLSAWTTKTDRTMPYALLGAGFFLAPAASSVLTAVTVCFIKWDASFYIIGGAGLLWTIVWFRYMYDRPDLHPELTSEQREYFRKHGSNVQKNSVELFRQAPWRSIVTSGGVWAAIIANTVKSLMLALLVMEEFQYFQDSFNINSEDVGVLLGVPYVLLGVTTMVGGLVSTRLHSLGLSITATRKTVCITSMATVGACCVTLSFVQDWRTAFGLLSAGSAMQGFGSVGSSPLISDMSPQFTGLIFGIVTLVSDAVATLSSTFISMTAGKYQSLGSWQTVYLMAGVMNFAGCVLFGILADATLQPWAEGTQRKVINTTDDTSMENSALIPKQNGLTVQRLLSWLHTGNQKKIFWRKTTP